MSRLISRKREKRFTRHSYFLAVLAPATALACGGLMLPALAEDEGAGDEAAAAFVEPKSYNSPKDLRDLPSIPITSWLHIGLLLEAEAAREEHGSQSRSDVSADAFSLAANAEWREGVSAFAVAKQELSRERDFDMEEAFLHLGGTESFPWYVEAGRMEMPFGEFEGRFVEDPLVQIIGETEGDGYIVGYETDSFEAILCVFQGNLADNDTDNFVAALKLDPWDGVEFGVSITSDLAESAELAAMQREFLTERMEEAQSDPEESREEDGEEEDDGEGAELPAPALALSGDSVAGLGAFAILDMETWVYSLEVVSALADFGAGVLDERARRPWGWNAEVALRPVSGLELAARLEYSDELPDEPEWQSGIALIWAVVDHVTIGANYLHATFRNSEPARDRIGMELVIEF